MKTYLAALALSSVAIVGCSPSFDRLEIDNLTTPPDNASITSSQIDIRVGIAIGVIATPYAGDEPMEEEDTTIELESDNLGVVGVDPGLEWGSFVIYGVGAGTANVRVVVNGETEMRIPASVTLQQ